MPLDVSAAPGGHVAAADGADGPLHGAAHGDLLFDTALDLGNEVGVGLGPEHVGPALEVAVGIARLCKATGFSDYLRPIDPGGLPPGAPLVVEDPALAHKGLCQGLQGLGGEPLPVPVHLVVAQPHRKEVYLVGGEPFPAEPVDEGQLGLIGSLTGIHIGGFFYLQIHPSIHFSPPFCMARALACSR